MTVDPRPPEHPGCVVGIALGILLAVLPLAALFLMRGETLDARTVLAEVFEWSELPFELELVEAAQLPGGVRVVRLAHPDFVAPEPEEPELEEESEEAAASDADEGSEGADEGADEGDGADGADEDGEQDSGASAKPFVPPPPPKMIPGTAPTEVFAAFYPDPQEAARAFLGAAGASGPGGGDYDGGPPMMMGMGMGGGPVLMDNGDLDWGDLRAGFRHERVIEGSKARDELRVNLSAQGRYCVLVARWPENHAGSREKIEELLRALSSRNG